MNGCLDIAEPFDNLVNHIDTEVSGAVSVIVVRADFWVNKQAKVRVVNLNDSDAFLAQEFDLAAQDGDAIGDERVTSGIGGAGFFGRPHAFAQQRGCGQGCLDPAVGDRL